MSTEPRLFDTSSLMAVLLDDDTPRIDVLYDEHVLDLTFYEAGNVLWKAHHLQGRIDEDELEQLVKIVNDLRPEVFVHELDEIGFDEVMDTAVNRELTFYDAAFLACAVELYATIVSEDSKLRRKGRKSVTSAVSLDELDGRGRAN